MGDDILSALADEGVLKAGVEHISREGGGKNYKARYEQQTYAELRALLFFAGHIGASFRGEVLSRTIITHNAENVKRKKEYAEDYKGADCPGLLLSAALLETAGAGAGVHCGVIRLQLVSLYPDR